MCVLRVGGLGGHRQQPDAAEEESRSARARPRQDREALFDAEDTWVACLAATTSVVAGLRLNAPATARAASGLLLATDVADYLVARGVPFREAHEIVGAIVRRLLKEHRSFDSLSVQEWREHSPLFGDDVRSAISAAASVERKQTPQSTNPRAVAAALDEMRDWLART
ncbi:MAG: hypothetical protein DMF85_00450 [Acidobacteria bacterium]|nr:MAG: hypothetical protein DMF85_00450 [Acidobacteriota bacterium]